MLWEFLLSLVLWAHRSPPILLLSLSDYISVATQPQEKSLNRACGLPHKALWEWVVAGPIHYVGTPPFLSADEEKSIHPRESNPKLVDKSALAQLRCAASGGQILRRYGPTVRGGTGSSPGKARKIFRSKIWRGRERTGAK